MSQNVTNYHKMSQKSQKGTKSHKMSQKVQKITIHPFHNFFHFFPSCRKMCLLEMIWAIWDPTHEILWNFCGCCAMLKLKNMKMTIDHVENKSQNFLDTQYLQVPNCLRTPCIYKCSVTKCRTRFNL
jgi:hypothetical protein